MSQVKDYRQTKTIELPGYEGSSVEIYNGILFGDAHLLASLQGEPSFENMGKALPKLIKSWNLTDEADKTLPISVESLNLLSPDAVAHIAAEVTAFIELKKKD